MLQTTLVRRLPPFLYATIRSARRGVLVVGAIGLVLASCQPKAKTEEEPAPVAQSAKTSLSGRRVEVVVIRPSSEQMSLTLPGEVRGFRDASLAAPLGGYIERVLVEAGELVKRSQMLVQVDSATHNARLARAKVELASAQRELARAQGLVGNIPVAEIDAAEDRVKLSKAAIAELSLNAHRTAIRAPFAGSVVRVDAEVGEVAPPGAPLLRLVQMSPIQVTVALSDRDIGLAREGASARVQLDARSGIYDGKVTRISRAADVKTRSFEAVIELPNEEFKLLPGMIANVTLNSSASDAAVSPAGGTGDAVPKTAASSNADKLVISQDWLVTRRDGVGVFVEDQGVARWRTVKLGEILRRQVVVESGLAAGDALIIVGHRELVDGDPVLVHRRGRCCVKGRAVFEVAGARQSVDAKSDAVAPTPSVSTTGSPSKGRLQ